MSDISLILGFGASGASCVRYLVAQNQRVLVCDDRADPPGFAQGLGMTLQEAQRAYPDVQFLLGEKPPNLQQVGRIIASPGVPEDHCLLRAARERGVPIACDIDLFLQAAKAPVIGVTGTNGKSTVTTLAAQLLAASGLDVGFGGNLGTPALELLAPQRQAYVLELSSFQLAYMQRFGLAAATVLNVSEDHIDRHGSFDAYALAKHRIYQDAELCVYNREDAGTRPQPAREPSAGRTVSFGADEPQSGHYGLCEHSGQSWLCHGQTKVIATDELGLVGSHNVLNALAALALLDRWQLPAAATHRALAEFKGLAHRSEFVATHAGVRYVNDSKATNVGATVAALQGLFDPAGARLIVLLGGQSKGADLAVLAPAVTQACSHAIVFGEARDELSAVLTGKVAVCPVADLAEAVAQAQALAQPGQTVLLSPACASFDQFRGFAARGDRFKELVAEFAS